MNCTMFLVPAVVFMFGLSIVNVKAHNEVKVTTKANTQKAVSTVTTSIITTQDNETSSQNMTNMTPTPIYPRPLHFGPMVKRMAIVAVILSAIVSVYFVVKLCHTKKRKARKYGIVKTPGDVEMRPLESDEEDDDEDDDITMFVRKQ